MKYIENFKKNGSRNEQEQALHLTINEDSNQLITPILNFDSQPLTFSTNLFF